MEQQQLDQLHTDSQRWCDKFNQWSKNHKRYGGSAVALAAIAAYDFQSVPATADFAWLEWIIGLVAATLAVLMTFFNPSDKALSYRGANHATQDALHRHKIGEIGDSELLDVFKNVRETLPRV